MHKHASSSAREIFVKEQTFSFFLSHSLCNMERAASFVINFLFAKCGTPGCDADISHFQALNVREQAALKTVFKALRPSHTSAQSVKLTASLLL